MTVCELIERLKEFPGSMPVVLMCTFDSGFCTVGGKITSVEVERNCIELWCDEWC